MRYGNRLLLIGFFSGICASIQASMLDFLHEKKINLSLNFGGAKLATGDASLPVTATETDTLSANNHAIVGDMALGVGLPLPLHFIETTGGYRWFTTIMPTLRWRYLSRNIFGHSSNGRVYQYKDPDLYNYQYTLDVASSRLMFDGVFTILAKGPLSAFLTAGLGAGWTRAAYNDLSLTDTMEGELELNTATTQGMVSEFGGGLLYQWHDYVGLSLEYFYSSYRHIKTGQEGLLDGMPTNISPARFFLHSQSVLLGFHIQW